MLSERRLRLDSGIAASRPVRVALVVVLVLALVLSWGVFLARTVWPAAHDNFWRQPGTWVGARLAAEGHPEYLYADGKLFARESMRLGANPDIFSVNFPTAIIPFLPLTPFDVNTARTIWISFGVLSFVAAWVLLLVALRLPLEVALFLSVLVPLFQPWRRDIFLGEIYAVLLLLASAAAVLATRAPTNKKRGLIAGVLVALACTARHYYGAWLLFLPLLRRQWSTVAAGVGLYAVAALGTLVLIGVDGWRAAIESSLTWRDKPETALTAYQSLNGFYTHLFRYDPTLNPVPLANVPALVGPLWLASVVLLLGVSVALVLRTRDADASQSPAHRLLPFALVAPLALLLAPISEDYHYTQTILPLLVTFAVLLERRVEGTQQRGPAIARWLALVVAAILLGAPWRFYNVPGADGWHALLYYPRLYGTLLLFGVMVSLFWGSGTRDQLSVVGSR